MSDTTTITIVGTLGADPTQRLTPHGPVTRFRVACNTRRLDKSTGEWANGPTSWYDISVWRGLGEHALRSLHKGQRVIVSGRLQVRDWQNSESRGTSADITADAVGHDLLFGTSTFEKAARSQPPVQEWSTAEPASERDPWVPTTPPASIAPAQAEPAGSETIGWANPGTAPTPVTDEHRAEEPRPAPARELVGADQTPF